MNRVSSVYVFSGGYFSQVAAARNGCGCDHKGPHPTTVVTSFGDRLNDKLGAYTYGYDYEPNPGDDVRRGMNDREVWR